AFATIAGTVEAIQGGNQEALRLAGVKLLADALNLSEQQRTDFEAAMREGRTPSFNVETIAVDRSLPIQTISALIAGDNAAQQKAEQELKEMGVSVLRQALLKEVPSRYKEAGEELVDQLLSSPEKITIESLLD